MRGVLPYGVTTGSAAAAPTPELWHLCPIEAILASRIRGWYFWEDFINFPVLGAADTVLHKWAGAADSGGTLNTIATAVGGVMQISADTADETAVIGTDGNAGSFVKLDADHRVWFEARWKVNTIANTTFGVFVGLTEEGLVKDEGIIAADGTMQNVDYIGFSRLEADGDQCEPIFNKENGTDVVMEVDAKTLVADQYVKTGFLWDPTNRQDRFLEIFFDGAKETQEDYNTVGSKANTITDTTNFPGDQELGVLLCNEAGATPGNLFVDWVKVIAMPIT
jgi:hypothetical protein